MSPHAHTFIRSLTPHKVFRSLPGAGQAILHFRVRKVPCVLRPSYIVVSVHFIYRCSCTIYIYTYIVQACVLWWTVCRSAETVAVAVTVAFVVFDKVVSLQIRITHLKPPDRVSCHRLENIQPAPAFEGVLLINAVYMVQTYGHRDRSRRERRIVSGKLAHEDIDRHICNKNNFLTFDDSPHLLPINTYQIRP